jgi:hypothetical protein
VPEFSAFVSRTSSSVPDGISTPEPEAVVVEALLLRVVVDDCVGVDDGDVPAARFAPVAPVALLALVAPFVPAGV